MDSIFLDVAKLHGLLYFVIFVLMTYLLLRLVEYLVLKPAPEEPPLVRSPVPFLGHIFGLLGYGVSYYAYLRAKTNLPILTLYLASQKTYIVNSPELIALISRRQKEIDGHIPFITIVYGKLFGFPQHDVSELLRNPMEKGSLRQAAHVIEHTLLAPNTAASKEVYTKIFNGLADHINKIGEGQQSIAIQQWLQTAFTLSTANALHGPNGPFAQSPDLVNTFWDFENGLKALTMGVLPSITASTPAAARQRLVDVLMDYFGDSFPADSACELVRRGREMAQEHNRGTEFMARYGLGLLTGFVINTVPATFWMVVRIARDATLLAKVREELSTVIKPSSHGEGRVTVDVSAIHSNCPLLMSICHETLRCISSSTGTFLVNQDVSIADQFVLKKGAILQMAATAIHSNPAVWGSDAKSFDAERFLKPNKTHPAANRTFGGGSTLCPGRHLAVDEMLTFTAMFIFTFDFMTTSGPDGLPEQDDTNMLSVKKPRSDVLLTLQRRQGMEHEKWIFGDNTPGTL
ncbi:hypothetical protein EsH8_I_000442 [Colletotrichum jinshuiense]